MFFFASPLPSRICGFRILCNRVPPCQYNRSGICEVCRYAPMAYLVLVDTIRTKAHRILVATIAAERQDRGITQVELAKVCRKSQTWVARLEAGDRRIDVVEFVALARVIGFDPAPVVARLANMEPELFKRRRR